MCSHTTILNFRDVFHKWSDQVQARFFSYVFRKRFSGQQDYKKRCATNFQKCNKSYETTVQWNYPLALMHAYHLYNGRTTSRRTVQYSTVRESIFCFDDFPHEVTSHVHSMSSCTQTVITISLASCPLLFQRPVHSHVHPRPVPPPRPL